MDQKLVTKKRFKKKGKSKKVFTNTQYKQIKSIAHNVATAPREIGFHDTAFTNYVQNYNGALNPLDIIPQGLLDSNRRGDALILKSIRFRLYGVVGSTSSVMRFMIVQWKSDQGPTMSKILQTAYIGTPNLVNAPYAHDYRDHCNVLYDKNYVLQTGTGADGMAISNDIIKSGFGREIKYQGGTSSSISNAIYMVTCSDVASGGPSLTAVIRLRFTDP